MCQAIAAVDRAALGFSSISTNAVVLWHDASDEETRYDSMLIIFDTPARYHGVYRNIEFRKTATGYERLREFEIHPGPMTFTQSGHTAHEEIYIIYDTTGISGVTPDELHVFYQGPDKRMANQKDLTIDKVKPILAKWTEGS